MQIRKARAQKALDAARAIARLGTARGASAFVRFGYIERNGQANLAVPLGRFRVDRKAHENVRLLDEIDAWVDALRRAARDPAPASLGRAVRNIESAMLALCRQESAGGWRRLLLALADAEALLTSRPKATMDAWLQPLPGLSPQWVAVAGEETPEVRLAAAIASQVTPARFRGALGPIRAHCMPLDPGSDPRSGYTRFEVDTDRIRKDPSVVWSGRDLVDDLGQVAARRLLEAERKGLEGFPLQGHRFARLDDIDDFLWGRVDTSTISRLARAFMAVRWNESRREGQSPVPSARSSPLHALFRLIYLPETLEKGGRTLNPRRDPAPLHLLLAGRLDKAARAAIHRLEVSGVRPEIRLASGSPEMARRLAASIAIPVSRADLGRLLDLLCKPIEQIKDDETIIPQEGTCP
jgi:CRISPR-associated protein Csx17